MLLLRVVIGFCGRNLKGDLKINYPRFKKKIEQNSCFFNLIQNHNESMSINIQCPNGYFVCVLYIIFDRVGHEQVRYRTDSILSIPTQFRIVPEHSVISMGTYHGRVPLWHSGLRIPHCHYCDLGRCYGTGSLSGLGTSTC